MNVQHLMMSLSIGLGGMIVAQGLSVPPAIAQLLYPPVSEQRAISVTGQGRASVPADQAQIDILLSNRNPDDPAAHGFPPEVAEPLPEPPPITFDSLRGIIDALVEAGLPEAAIDVNLPTVETLPYDYSNSDPSITLDIEDPTREQINEIVTIVDTALETQATQQFVFIRRIFVQYAIESCEVVEQRAYATAMADAQLRAVAIADAIDAALVEPPSVAELPFLGRFLSPCNEDTDIVGALFWSPESSYYNPEAPAEVEVYREVLVTYPVE
ncbi:MAG: SIMPL domain-containing protein [Leptolyngbya sp. SIO1D8]|nr:SIMPL domain-containing protein [Leptolyngbya sp. SIO1D8]